MRRLPLRLALLLLALPSAASASVRAEKPHLDVELISSVEALAPGAPFTLGLRYTVEPGWHVYWKNPGDSGMEPSVRWRAPRSVAIGPLQWPAPKLIRLKHLANYGYEGEAILLADAHAADSAPAGGSVTIGARLEWLVCKEDCLPGDASLELELPVAAAARPHARHLEALTAARSRVPLDAEALGWSASARLERRGVHLRLAPPDGSALPPEASLFPQVGGWVHAAGVQRSLRQDGALHLFAPLREDPDREPPSRLAAVLVAGGGTGWRGPDSEPGLAVDLTWSDELPDFAALEGAAAGSGPGLVLAALLAFAGGILLNLMPCVLPVLSLKVLSFARAAAEGRRASLVHAGWFSAGVVASFWAVAAALLVLRGLGEQLGWGFQLQSPVVVAALAALFTLLALNLFGVFEVGAPALGVRAPSSGPAGAFGSGVLATLVATPCTAPFMGGAVGAALVGPWWFAAVVFTALGAGMAFPYLLLAAFPPLLRRLPKPGPWMESLRQGLGFLLLATVAWLLWVYGGLVDAAGEVLGVNGLVRLLGGLLLVALGAWLLGRFGAPSAPTLRRRAVQGAAALSVAAGLFLPVRAVTAEVERLDWKPWSPELVEELEAAGRPYFLDFTADWCLSCQVNEQVALDTAGVKAAFERHGITAVKADWTNRDERIARALAAHGRASVPVYVLNPGRPGADRLLPNILTESLVLDAIEAGMRNAP